MKTLKIYLCDLTYNTISVATDSFPLNIGFVAAYCKHKFGDLVDIELFKYPDDLEKALKKEKPDILGMSNYPWNFNLGLTFFNLIKKISPNTITVMGGPNIPLNDEDRQRFILKNPLIDFYVYLEGEEAFSNLVERVFEHRGNLEKMKLDPINGIVHRIDDKNLVKGLWLKRRTNLDEIPSPYLGGFMDKFFDGKLSPMLETNRGCPFTCTYCHEGHSLITKVNYFSTDRVFAELDYIGERAPKSVSHLMFCDPNFGMYERDLSICEHISKMQEKKNYPRYIFASTGKNRKDRIAAAISKLNGSLKFWLSVQSMDKEVLKNIERSNIKLDVMTGLAVSYSKLGLPSFSEIIICLPGETLESHLNSLSKLLDSGIGAITTYNLMLLNGTEMNTKSQREKFGLKSHFRVIPRDFGKLEQGDISAEIEEIVTSTNHMSFEEYVEGRIFHLLIQIIFNNEVFSPFFKLMNQRKIPIMNFFKKLKEEIELSPKSLNNFVESFKNDTCNELWDSEKELLNHVKKEENYKKLCNGTLGHNLLQTYNARAIKLLPEWNDFIFEMFKETLEYDVNNLDEKDMVNEINIFCLNRLHNIWGEDRTLNNPFFNFKYDISSWINNEKESELNEFKFNSPTRVDFKFSKQQNIDISDNIKRFGNTPTGIGRIIVKMGMVSKVLRQPLVTIK
jgi:radical SAM superfamily enzyme YgiQ (UPF0313 family)